MRIQVFRDIFTDLTTTSIVELNGKFQCNFLEDKDRQLEIYPEAKIYGGTCIPRGTYDLVLDFSPRYNTAMPHILDVPDFEGIRIHPGNWHTDTEGCPLPGTRRSKNMVHRSVAAFEDLFSRLLDAEDRDEKVTIEFI